jgi:cysteine-rich repeat protein
MRGPDTIPPRIISITPGPGNWVVDNLGIDEIQFTFDEPVTVPVGAVSAWTVGQGDLSTPATSYDNDTNTLTLSFTNPIRDDRLTIVLDYTITDTFANALDGEIANPAAPLLPSGDAKPGGQAVFRFNILQGDATRDGIVDAADATLIQASLGKCSAEPGFKSEADLNGDGCVNVLDVATFTVAEGRVLPSTDGFPPFIIEIAPEPSVALSTDVSSITLNFTEPIDPLRFNRRTCFLVDASGILTVPSSAELALDGLSAMYDLPTPRPRCSAYSLNVSNALADPSGTLLSRPSPMPVLSGLVPPAPPTLNSHSSASNAPPPATITITGNAPTGSSIEIAGPTEVITVPTSAGTFTANVPLDQNRINQIFFTTIADCGARSSPITRMIWHDAQDPALFVDFPTDGAQITTGTTDVAGRVGDVLSGFMGLTVTVNGATCTVNRGIGNNGTFLCQNVPLASGNPTVIQATATDVLGNAATKQISVTRTVVPPNSPQMVVLYGNAQSAQQGTVLPAPIVVWVTRADGTPFVNKIVTFHVTRSNGRLGTTTLAVTPTPQNRDPGSMMLQVHADANGEARAYWRLGSDAGSGNNRVEVTSRDIAGTVVFCASSTPAPAIQINVAMGNNQRAEVGGFTPDPLRVWASDGCNGGAYRPITFTVTQGLGKVNGLDAVTVNADPTGHADVRFQLGPEPGHNVVEATFPGNMSLPATFVAIGIPRNLLEPTRFSGLVLNNASQPIENVKCTLAVDNQSPLITYSDAAGQFQFGIVTGAGHADLYADGSTATAINGVPITGERYPFLHFEPVIIPNAQNLIGMPVLLPPLNPANDKVFDNTQDVELTVDGMEGLKMIARAGSMTRANGTVPSPSDPATLSLNQVHHDDTPMPLPDGAAPLFAWTLQPGGSRFDPPVEIIYPNMTGQPPGAIGYFLSFNHDTNRFEIVGSGHILEDGSALVTDPGAGIRNAGWGGACPPYPFTGDGCNPGGGGLVAGAGETCGGCAASCGPCEECTAEGCQPIATTSPPACAPCQLNPGANVLLLEETPLPIPSLCEKGDCGITHPPIDRTADSVSPCFVANTIQFQIASRRPIPSDPCFGFFINVTGGGDANPFVTDVNYCDIVETCNTYNCCVGVNNVHFGNEQCTEIHEDQHVSDVQLFLLEEATILMQKPSMSPLPMDGSGPCLSCGEALLLRQASILTDIDLAFQAAYNRMQNLGESNALQAARQCSLQIGANVCEWAGTLCGNALLDQCQTGFHPCFFAPPNSVFEQCDDGGDSPTCDADCTIVVCGDGYRNPQAEECDDGNNQSGDGCSENCQIETAGE